MNRGHKQSDMIVMDSLRPLTRSHIKGYNTNLTFTGLEDLHISGSSRGSLSALKKWY